jgi:hypothetical protein
MKTLIKILLFGAFVAGLTSVAIASTGTAESGVTITFSEISVLAVSGDPATITITAPAVAGNLPDDKTNALTTMAWTSNVGDSTTRKITGKLDATFSGIDLYATVAASGGAGGTTANEVKFALTDNEFVTGIGNCNVSAKTITFRANVTSMVAPYESTKNTVTWTLTEDTGP